MAIIDFYKGSCFWGNGVVSQGVWSTGSTPTLTVTPDADYAVYISAVVFTFPDTLVLAPNTLDINPWGMAIPPTISIADIRGFYDLAAWIGDKNVSIGATNYHWIRLEPRPFILLLDSAGDSFTIENSGGAASAMTGTLQFTVFGHTIEESEL